MPNAQPIYFVSVITLKARATLESDQLESLICYHKGMKRSEPSSLSRYGGPAHITRDDAKGAALAIYRSTTNGVTIVKYIANIMNPVGALTIKVDPHDRFRDKLLERGEYAH
jgi:hypothetical protein